MKPATYSIHDFTFKGTSLSELRHIIKEVFDQHIYYFESNVSKPRIIDLGAHIGIATHYFAKMHPNAEITSVEPHPLAFKLLKENCDWNRLNNVTVVQAAVVPTHTVPASQEVTETTTKLYTDSAKEWLSSTSIYNRAWNKTQEDMVEITVPTIHLAKLIHSKPVDLLKIDIEGAEWDVLLKAGDELRNVAHLILEYHPRFTQDEQKIVQHLKKFGLQLTEDLPISPKKRKKLHIVEFKNNKLLRKRS